MSTIASSTTTPASGLNPPASTAGTQVSENKDLALLFSRVPWMSFCIVAKPDVNELAKNEVFKAFINHIITTTATTVSKNIQSQLTVAMTEAFKNVGGNLNDQVKTVQDTIMKEITRLPLQITATEYEKLDLPMEQLLKDLCKCPPRRDTPILLPPPSIQSANWIWTSESTVPAPPVGHTRAFRRTVITQTPVNALTIDIAADDMYTVYVNGKLVGSGGEWRQPDRYTIRFEETTRVVVAVIANQGANEAYIGIIAVVNMWNCFDITPTPTQFVTDSKWVALSANGISDAFVKPDFVDASWTPARVLVGYGVAPWLVGEMKPTLPGRAPGKGIQGVRNVPDAPNAPAAEQWKN